MTTTHEPDGLLERAMRAVPRHMQRVLADHSYGPLRAITGEHLATGGKRFRARLCLEAAAAFDVDPLAAVPLASACELLHNATLVHDDLQDGDAVRRGRPAVWARHGVDQAINAGDLMLVLPTLALGLSGYADEVRWRLAWAFARRAAATASGQSLEQSLRERVARDPAGLWEAYELAVIGKTGALCTLPVEGAALLAGASPDEAAAVGDAVGPLGVLFQVRDDVLDLWGDKGRGRRGNDLREGKVSALVAAHVAHEPADWPRLSEVLQAPRERTRDCDVAWAIRRFEEAGTLSSLADKARVWVRTLTAAPALEGAPRLREVVMRAVEALVGPLQELVLTGARADRKLFAQLTETRARGVEADGPQEMTA